MGEEMVTVPEHHRSLRSASGSVTLALMDAHAVDASDAARQLALARWSPEARRASAVRTVVEHWADLDDDQRAAIEAAISTEVPDE